MHNVKKSLAALVSAMAIVGGLAGCEVIVSPNRSLIPEDATAPSGEDAASDAEIGDATPSDAAEAATDAPVQGDAAGEGGDAMSDASGGGDADAGVPADAADGG